MKNGMFSVAAALAGVIALGGIAAAQPHHGGFEHGGMEFLHGLNLTEAQKTQMHEIEKASWQQMKPLMKQDHDLHEQLVNQFLVAGSVTAEQFQPIIAQEESLRTQIETAHLNTMLQIRGILTPDQLSKAATLHAQMEQLHEQEHALMAGPGDAE